MISFREYLLDGAAMVAAAIIGSVVGLLFHAAMVGAIIGMQVGFMIVLVNRVQTIRQRSQPVQAATPPIRAPLLLLVVLAAAASTLILPAHISLWCVPAILSVGIVIIFLTGR